jgi:hypothetical protein
VEGVKEVAKETVMEYVNKSGVKGIVDKVNEFVDKLPGGKSTNATNDTAAGADAAAAADDDDKKKKQGLGSDVKFSLGLTIKPHLFNYAMVAVEVVLKEIIRVILVPFLYVVQALQIAMEYFIRALEVAEKEVRTAQKELDKIEKKALRSLTSMYAKQKKYSMHEAAYKVGKRLKQAEGDTCRARGVSLVSAGCVKINGKEVCGVAQSASDESPANCDQVVARAVKEMDDHYDECCGFWTTITRAVLYVFIRIVENVIKLVMAIPKMILKIVQLLLATAKAVLKVAQAAIAAAMRMVYKLGINTCLDKRNRVVKPKLNRWLKNLEILRVYELSCAMQFTPDAMSFEATVDLVFFSNRIHFTLAFSFDFKTLVKNFVNWVKEQVEAFWSGGTKKEVPDPAAANTTSTTAAKNATSSLGEDVKGADADWMSKLQLPRLRWSHDHAGEEAPVDDVRIAEFSESSNL